MSSIGGPRIVKDGLVLCLDAANSTASGERSLQMMYNRALSASEVLQNYNATKNRFGL